LVTCQRIKTCAPRVPAIGITNTRTKARPFFFPQDSRTALVKILKLVFIDLVAQVEPAILGNRQFDRWRQSHGTGIVIGIQRFGFAIPSAETETQVAAKEIGLDEIDRGLPVALGRRDGHANSLTTPKEIGFVKGDVHADTGIDAVRCAE